MRVLTMGEGSRREAPFAQGPRVAALLDEGEGTQVAVAQVVVPAGGAMPEHDHGDSEALVIPLTGELVITDTEREHVLSFGEVVHIPRGDRVRLDNRGDEPASVIAVLSPPSFIRTFDSWPVATE